MPENFEGQNIEQEEKVPVIAYAEKGDCPGIVEVGRDQIIQRFVEHGVPMREFNKEEGVKNFEKEITNPNRRLPVLKVGQEVIGYFKILNDEQLAKKLNCKNKTVFVDGISVIRQYQGQGNGPKLVERGIDEGKNLFGAKYMLAKVVMENEPAVKMWQNMDFKQVTDPQPTKGTWDGKPSHTIMMEKDLD